MTVVTINVFVRCNVRPVTGVPLKTPRAMPEAIVVSGNNEGSIVSRLDDRPVGGEATGMYGKYPHQSAMNRRVSHATRRRIAAFTLMEVLMASVVLSIAVAAISQAVISGQSHAYESLHRMRSAALGQALMEEISSLAYPDIEQGQPGHAARPSRRGLYDTMDDFNDFEEASGTLVDQVSRSYDAAYQKFSRAATVKTKTVSIAPLGDMPGLEITVTVTDERGGAWQIVRFMPRPAEDPAS